MKKVSLICLLSFLPFTFGGCVSGGYKLTRKLSAWNNSLNIFLRIPLYFILTFTSIYFATLFLDAIIFNVMDFWEGKVSLQESTIQKDDLRYVIKNTRNPLRQTTIAIYNSNNTLIEQIEIKEIENGKIESWVNGRKKLKVNLPALGSQLLSFSSFTNGIETKDVMDISNIQNAIEKQELRIAKQ